MFHPAYWAYVAGDMDILWPGNDYTLKVLTIGKALFQDPRYAWRAVAAWYKKTNNLIAGCAGYDLFTQSYEVQTKCTPFGGAVDRSQVQKDADTCVSTTMKFPEKPKETNGNIVPATQPKAKCVP